MVQAVRSVVRGKMVKTYTATNGMKMSVVKGSYTIEANWMVIMIL